MSLMIFPFSPVWAPSMEVCICKIVTLFYFRDLKSDAIQHCQLLLAFCSDGTQNIITELKVFLLWKVEKWLWMSCMTLCHGDTVLPEYPCQFTIIIKVKLLGLILYMILGGGYKLVSNKPLCWRTKPYPNKCDDIRWRCKAPVIGRNFKGNESLLGDSKNQNVLYK